MFNFKQYIQELRCILKDAAEKSIWNLCHKEKIFGLENRKRHGEIIHDDNLLLFYLITILWGRVGSEHALPDRLHFFCTTEHYTIKRLRRVPPLLLLGE
jgi:hypothetical protein